MAGRALAFADPEIIRMATQDYVSVAGDDWYQRRRQDAEGEFFRKVADQGPRKGEGGSTRQGIYCLTADGKLLAYKNAGQDADVMREVLRQGLAAWRKLPANQQRTEVANLDKVDPQYDRRPPSKALIVNVYTRSLERDAQGKLVPFVGRKGIESGTARDHLWLTESEWKSLLPVRPRQGDRTGLPSGVLERVARFHLVDNTRGEPPHWRREEIRARKAALVVEKVTPESVRLRLEGEVLLSAAEAKRGFEAQLLGYVDYDPVKKSIQRFDIVALGEHWGEGTYTRRARPGRSPLGIAFELAKGDCASDLVPPQGAREIKEYLGTR